MLLILESNITRTMNHSSSQSVFISYMHQHFKSAVSPSF